MLASSVYHHFRGLWHAIDVNDLAAVALHGRLEAELNDRQHGYTPLLLVRAVPVPIALTGQACERHSEGIVRVLLEAGADPNAIARGRTPLSVAVLHGEIAIVEALLEHGAHPDTQCRDAAPLHVAAGRGLLSECRLLVQHGANVSVLSPRYGTPLHVAVRLNHQFIARFLVEAGARYDLLNADGSR